MEVLAMQGEPFQVDIQDVVDSYNRQLAERGNQLAMAEARIAALTRALEDKTVGKPPGGGSNGGPDTG